MRQLSRIQKDALTNSWSEEDFEAVRVAVCDVYKASRIARREGLLALEDFETKSKFFQWSISIVTDGTDPEYFEELLKNRYFTGRFNGIEKCIYYVYARGSLLLQSGITDQLMQEFLVSIVPEPYRGKMCACIDSCKEELENNSYKEAEKIAKEFFKNQDFSVLNPEEQEIKQLFDTIFQSMSDRSIQTVLQEVKTCVFEAAALYAEEATRIRIQTNLPHRLYKRVVRDWQSMFHDYKRSIESMQIILVVCKKLQEIGAIIVPECRNSKITIRKMELSDYKEVDSFMQQLHNLHVKERPDLYVALEHPYSKEKYESLINSDQEISLLSEQDGIVTGICFAEIRNRSMMVNMTTAYMNDIIVKDSYRRQGIAHALFLAIEEQAKKKGAQRIDVTVWSFNKDAIAFYEKVGMIPQRFIYEKFL